jgi:hypothetical protein
LSSKKLFRKVEEEIVSHTALVLNKKNTLTFILVIMTVIVFDTTIVSFSSYSGVELHTSLNSMIFVIFSIIFVLSSAVLVNSVRKVVSKYAYKPAQQGLKYLQGAIIVTLFLTYIIIIFIIFQMVFINNYSLVLLQVQTFFSHLSALVFLSFLIFLLLNWLTSKRNYVILLYAISFSLAAVDIMVALIYVESYFSTFSAISTEVIPYPITAYVINLPGSPLTESLSMAFDVLSLSSFLIMWIATSIFLSQYRYKMGRIKYFSLMSIPLVYYVFPFQNYFGDAFLSLLETSPILYSVLYILTFSATKQAGALLFSLYFWTASSLVYDDRVRQSLLISSIGMAILFGSLEITPLQYRVYPPYGLITEAFMPLGSYLLVVGIFTSAKHISRDVALRKEFHKSAASQLRLLKAIGVSQMEKELESEVKYVAKRAELIQTRDEPELEHEEIKQILHDVLNELYYSKGKKEIQHGDG